MNINKITSLLCACVVSLQALGGCKRSGIDIAGNTDPSVISPVNIVTPADKKKLIVRSIGSEEFNASIRNPRRYETGGLIKAGVIPHHTVGATLISGFFQAVAKNADDYDTVLIVSPNHNGDKGDIILSRCDWDTGSGVLCDIDIVNELLGLKISNVSIAENDERMEEDHSASVLMPYIDYYLPKARVAPILVSRTLTLDNTLNFGAALSRIIRDSDKRILLVCSIDFSHYLTPAAAAQNDKITVDAIENMNYKQIHDFSNEYMDSPAALIIFLQYLSELGMTAQIIDNTDASEFLGSGLPETTSYFVIVGCED